MSAKKNLSKDERLSLAKQWISSLPVKEIPKAYRRKYKLSWEAAFEELKLLEIFVDPEYKRQILQSVDGLKKCVEKKSKRKPHSHKTKIAHEILSSKTTNQVTANNLEIKMPIGDDAKKFVLHQMANYLGLRGLLEIKWKELRHEAITFRQDIEFWERLFRDDYGEFLFHNKGMPVTLRHFKLSTWLPFVPGLFYRRAHVENYQFRSNILRSDNGYIIFDADTKTDLVINGFSNVRFDRMKVDNDDCLLLNAYTSHNSCYGIPVLVRDRDIDVQNLEDINTRFKYEIHGVLDYFTSNDKRFQFAPSSNKIPIIKALGRLLINETEPHQEEAEASAWSLLDVSDKKINKPCCVFCRFTIGNRESRVNANRFIKDYFLNQYQTSRYNIITDYDEISPSLNAEYGIGDIGTNELLFTRFQEIRRHYNL